MLSRSKRAACYVLPAVLVLAIIAFPESFGASNDLDPDGAQNPVLGGAESDVGVPAKFGGPFYEKIRKLASQESGSGGRSDTRYYDTVIVVPRYDTDGNDIADQQKSMVVARLEEAGAMNIRPAESLLFVTASVPVGKILGLSLHDEVYALGDGEVQLTVNLDKARPTIHATPSEISTSNGTIPDGSGVTVAVIDTGINHTGINDRVLHSVDCGPSGCNTVNSTTTNSNSHGTRVAWIIGGSGDMGDRNGIAPGISFIDLTAPNTSSVYHALDWAVTNGAKVVNMSFSFGSGGGSCNTSAHSSRTEELILEDAANNGIVIANSAGNSGIARSMPQYHSIDSPSCASNIIAVGGINDRGTLVRMYEGSSKGPYNTGRGPILKPDMVAPAVSIHVPGRNAGSGTSFSAPMVSAAAALILGEDDTLGPAKMKAMLLLGANWTGPVPCTSVQYEQYDPSDGCSYARELSDRTEASRSLDILNNVGFGILDVAKSLEYVRGENHAVVTAITKGVSHEYAFNVTGAEGAVKVILVWFNPSPVLNVQGSGVAAGRGLYHDLDLEVNCPEMEAVDARSRVQFTEFAVFTPEQAGTCRVVVTATDLDRETGAEYVLASTRSLEASTAGPEVLSAFFNNATGEVRISFDERVNVNPARVDPSKIYVRENGTSSGGIDLDDAKFLDASDLRAVAFNLTEVQSSAVRALDSPSLAIDAGAVRDISGNAVEAISDHDIEVISTPPPAFSSVTLDETTKFLVASFNDDIQVDSIDATKFHVREQGSDADIVTLFGEDLVAVTNSTLVFRLSTFEMDKLPLTTTQLVADAGAVAAVPDIALDEAIAADILVDRNRGPKFSSAAFDNATGILTVAFDEEITSSVTPFYFRIGEAGTESSEWLPLTSSDTKIKEFPNRVSFSLTSPHQEDILSLESPMLWLGEAVSDTDGNTFDASGVSAGGLVGTYDIAGTGSVRGLTFGDGGNKAYVAVDDQVRQVALDMPFNMSGTPSATTHSLPAGSSPVALAVNGAGTGMLVLEESDNRVLEYEMTTAFDAGSASNTGDSFALGTLDPSDLTIGADGRRVFIPDASAGSVDVYDLAGSFDASSAEWVGSFSVAPQETSPTGLAIETDGKRMYVVGSDRDAVHQYTMYTPFDLSTASYDDVSLPVEDVDGSPEGLALDDDNSRIFVLGDDNDIVAEYALDSFELSVIDSRPAVSSATLYEESRFLEVVFDAPLGYFNATKFHIGEQDSDIVDLGQSGKLVDGGSTILFRLNSSEILAVPANPVLMIDAGSVLSTTSIVNGETITHEIVVKPSEGGPAVVSTSFDAGTGNLAVTFDKAVDMSTLDATKFHIRVTDKRISQEVDLTADELVVPLADSDAISFNLTEANRQDVISLSSPLLRLGNGAVTDTSGNPYDASFDVLAADREYFLQFGGRANIYPQSLTLADNGQWMYVIRNDDVVPYSLSPRYNVIGITSAESRFDVLGVGNAEGLAISDDGSRMFVLSSINSVVFQYDLSNNFEPSSATPAGSSPPLTRPSEDASLLFNQLLDLQFSTDGRHMFVIRSSSDAVDHFELASPFDAREPRHVDQFDSGESAEAYSFAFSAEGTRLYLAGDGTVHQYTLLRPYDLETAAGDGFVQLLAPRPYAGIDFSDDGHFMFILDDNQRRVHKYLLGTSPIGVTADETPPELLSASLDASKGELTVTFDETIDISKLNATKFHIGVQGSSAEIDLLPEEIITTGNSRAVTFELNQTRLALVPASPQLDLDQGAVSDTSGNPIGAVEGRPIDSLPVVLSIVRHDPAGQYTNDASPTFRVTFNKPVTAVDASDFVAERDTPGGMSTITTSTVSGSEYNVTVSVDTDGLLGIVVDAGSDITDTSGNPLASTVPLSDNEKYSIDTAAPSPKIESTLPAVTNAQVLQFEVDFGEAIQTGSFGAGGVNASSGTVSEPSTTDGTYFAFQVSGADEGSFEVSILAGAAADLAGNPSEASEPFAVTLDRIPPTITIPGSNPITISDDEIYQQPVATCDGAPATVESTDVPNPLAVGTYQVVYSCTDEAQNTTQEILTVEVYAGMPKFSSATLEEWTNLTITFIAPVTQTDPSKIHLRAPNSPVDAITLSQDELGVSTDPNSIVFNLTEANRQSAASKGLSRLTLEGSAVASQSGDPFDPSYDISGAERVRVAEIKTPSPVVPKGIAFNGNGSRMFIADTHGDMLHQYALDAAFDVSTLEHVAPSKTLPEPGGIAFGGNGTRLFTASEISPAIHGFYLDPAFDIGGLAVSDADSFAAGPGTATGVATSNDGMRLFVLTTGDDALYQYDMSTPFNVSTANASNPVTLAPIADSPSDMVFSSDGTRMLVINSAQDHVVAYKMPVPFDISAASPAAGHLDVGQDSATSPSGIAFDNGGTRLFVATESDPARVFQYDLGVFELNLEDTTKPGFSSAELDEGTGVLNISFDEAVKSGSVNLSKLRIKDSAGTQATFLTGAMLTTASDGSTISITLAEEQRRLVITMTTPVLTIQPSAVIDISGNRNSKLANNAITVTEDTTGPRFSSAELDEGLGILSITFTEYVNASSVQPGNLFLRDETATARTGLDGSMPTTTSDSQTISITLSEEQRQSTIAMAVPVLDVDAGAVLDMSGNAAVQSAGNAIAAVPDAILPYVQRTSLPVLDKSTGTLNVTFTEPVDANAIVPSGFRIRQFGSDGNGVVMSGDQLQTVANSNVVSFALNATNIDTVRPLSPLQLVIESSAIRDTSGNPIDFGFSAGASQYNKNHTVSESSPREMEFSGDGTHMFVIDESCQTTRYDLNAPYEIESASSMGSHTPQGIDGCAGLAFNGEGTRMFVTYGFDVDSTIHRYDMSVSFDVSAAVDTSSEAIVTLDDSPESIAFSADGESLFVIGRYSDAVTMSPTMSAFDLPDTSGNIVSMSLNARLARTGIAFSPDGMVMTLATSGATDRIEQYQLDAPFQISGNYRLFDVISDLHASNTSPTDVAFDRNGGSMFVLDSQGKIFEYDLLPHGSYDIAVQNSDTAPPTFSSAEYTTGNGELAVTFSESIGATVDLAGLHVRESGSSTGGFALTGSTYAVSDATATFTLTQSQRTSLAALTTPQLDIDANAVSDLSENGIAAAPDLAITIDDTAPPTFSSAEYTTGNGELAVTFSESIGATVDLAGLHVRESGSSTGGFALTGSTYAVSDATATFTLTQSQRTSLAALTTPQLDIDANAVSDLSENGIAAAPDLAITIDDTAPPTFSSAEYTTGNGELAVTFSESIGATVDLAGLHVRESGSSTGGFALTGSTYAVSGENVTFTLTQSQRTSLAALTTPQLDIDANAVSDLSENGIAAAPDREITVDDTAPPTFSSAEYTTGNGELAVTFSESLHSTVDLAGLHVRESGSSTGGFALTGSTYAVSDATATFTLTQSQRTSLAALTTPQLDIDANAVSDLSENGIAAAPDREITVDDTAPPTFSSAEYTTGNGELAVTFSESIGATVDLAGLHVRESGSSTGGFALTGSTYAVSDATATFTLTQSQRTSLAALTTPQLDIDANAVSDLSENGIAAAPDLAITIDDTAPPTFSSAEYTTGNGELAVTFSESIGATVDLAGLHVRESGSSTGGFALTGSTYAVSGENVTFTLTQSQRTSLAALTTPQLDIDANAVSDLSENGIAAAPDREITVDDTAPPTFSSAEYTTGNGELAVTFSESLHSTVDLAGLHVRESGSSTGGFALTGSTYAVSGENVTFTLTQSQRTSLAALTTPQLDIDANAVSDLSENGIAAAPDREITVDDTAPPTFSSAEYTTGNGELAVTFSESLHSTVDLAGLHVRESGSSTGGFALTGSTYAVSGENVTFTLTQSQRTSLAALTTPQLDIDANAVSDLSENGIAAAPDLAITIDDTAPPTFSSAEYTTGNGELAVTFSESIGATVDLAGLHVRESGSSTGGFALTGSTYAVSGENVTFTLTQSQRTSLAALTTPQLDIDANAVSDLSENGIAAAPDREITVDDTAPPTFSSAEYTTGNGELAVTFSESLHSTVDLAGLHVRESGSSTGGFALTGSTYAVSDATATFTLTQSQRTSLAALTTPQLDIDANAVSDLSENGIAAAPDLAITIDDTAPPTFSSAEYTTGNGELAVTFSESLHSTVDLAGLHVRESGSSTGGFALTGSTYAVSDATATFTLTQSQRTSLAALTTPQLDIDANAVSDLSENGIAAAPDLAITIDDTAPPTFSSAEYTTGNGELAVTFSESLHSTVDLAGLHVRESGSSTGGFALTGSTYAVSGENVTFTLTQSQRTSLAALTTPQLDIDANAVSDLSENGIAAAPDREITVDDTAPPTFSSAEYTTGNGELAVTFSESIGATVDLAGLHVRESGSSTGGFALTGSTYAVSDATATFTLTQSQRTSLAALTTPQLDIDANAVSDLSENGIAAAPDREITVDDTAPPTFSSAEYTTGNGELAVTFSESIGATVDLAGLHVRESGSSTGGFALTGSTYAVSGENVTFTLTQSQRTSLAALTTPQLDIDANAVSDLSENGIAAAPDREITVDDTAPPTFSSAEYTTGNGELAVTFSESIGATVDLAGLHVRESGSSTGGFALTGSTYAVSDATATFTLTQSQRTSLAALTTPQLDIDANAVSDLSENGIAAAPDLAITIDDTAPPTFSSAEYTTGNGELAVTFSESLHSTVDLAGLHVRESGSSTGGFALTGSTYAVSGENVTFTLTQSQRTSLAALTTPQLDIDANAVSDLSENGIAAAPDREITVDDTAPPTFSSAEYTTGNGELAVTFSESLHSTVDLAGLHVRESGSSTGGFALTGSTYAVSGENVTFTLTQSQRTSLAALTTPQLDIDANAVSDLSENGIAAAPDREITVDDTAPPTFSSAEYTTGNGELAVTFSESLHSTVDLAGLHVRESGSSTGGFALTGSTYAVSGENVTFTLTQSQRTSLAALTTPQLDIDANAVSDLSENGIAAAPDREITVDDTAPPTFSSAEYTTGNGELAVTFSESLHSTVDLAGLHVRESGSSTGGFALTGSTYAVSGENVTFTLTQSQRTSLAALTTPQLDIDANAVSDLSENGIAAAPDREITVDDTAPPTFSSAEYTTGNGELAVTFSESLHSTVDLAGLHVRESGSSTGGFALTGSTYAVSDATATFTLTQSQRTSLAALTTPQLDIDANAVSDLSENGIAAAPDREITVDDTAPPTFSSAEYTTGNGELAVTFSESIGATVDLAGLHVRESGSSTGGFALTGSTYAVSDATATFTLTQSQRTSLAALTTPQLDIDANAVSDLSENGIAAAPDLAITIDDTAPPTFSSAEYTTGNGELAVTFSESIGATVDLAGLHVRESGSSTGGFALTGSTYAVSGENVTFTLTQSQRTSLAALTTPQLDIDANAVSDLSENGIAAAPDREITVDDTAPPTFSSAEYTTGNGELAVTFSESIGATVDLAGLHVRESGSSTGGFALTGSTYAVSDATATFTLTQSQRTSLAALTTPQLDIDANAVSDLSENGIAAAPDLAITIDDTAPPTFSSAEYTTGNGELAVTFSESLHSTVDLAGLHVRESGSSTGGFALTGSTYAVSGENVTFTLTQSQRTSLAALTTPQLDIDANAVSDLSENGIAAAPDREITVDDTAPPTFSSAEYTTGNGELAVTFSESIGATVDLAGLHVRESGSSTGGFALTGSTYAVSDATATFTLTQSQRTSLAALTTPQLDIDANAVSDLSENGIAAAPDLAITIDDTAPPTFSSAEYTTGNGELAVTFSESLHSTVDLAGLHVRESGSSTGGFALTGSTYAVSGENVTFTLTQSQRTSLAALTTPQLDIDANAVSDLSENGIAAAPDREITVDDTAPPTFSSAEYTTGNGELAVTFSESIGATVDLAGLHVRESGSSTGGFALTGSTYAVSDATATFTLTQSQRTSLAALTTPQLDIDANAVSDLSENGIAAAPDLAITIDDTAPPTFSSAEYTTGNGELAVTFSESLHSTVDLAGLHVRESGSSTGGFALTGSTYAVSDATATFTLTQSQRTSLAALTTPQLDIDANAVSDLSENGIAAAPDREITVDDTAPPTFSSAEYTTGNGELAVTFSESLHSTVDLAGLHVRESGSSTGGFALTGSTYAVSGENVTFTLTQSQRTSLAALTTPQLDIDANAVSDLSENGIAAAPDREITVDDTAPPTFSSAEYTTGNGELAVTFSESLHSTVDLAGLHVRESGSSTGGFALTGSTYAVSDATATFTLTQSQRTSLAALTTPQLDIDANAVSDLSENGIAAAPDREITVDDTAPPTFSSAEYTTGNGELAVTFSESIGATVDLAGLHVRESGSSTGGFALTGSTYAVSDATATFTLTQSQRTSLAALTTPQLDIDANAVSDLSENGIAAAPDLAITIDDTAPPTFSSAEYTTGNGELAVTFSESIGATVDLAGLHVRESGSSTGGFALTGSTYAVSGENVTFTLTQSQRTSLAALTTPQLDIDANAVSDLSENGIAAAPDREITVDDTAPPTFSSAEYTTGNGELAVTFSESIGATVDLAGLHVRESGSSTGGFALTGSTYAVSDATATFTLTQSQRTSLAALTTPQLDIDANAVSDLSENGIAAAPDLAITIDDTAPPTFSSAEYTTGNGELAVTFSESLHSTVDLAGLHVRESGSSTGGFALTGSTYAISGENVTFTLTQSQRTSLAALTTPQLDIDANAVSDLSENGIAAAPDREITVDDTAPPTFSSAEYTTGNGELAVTFSESLHSTVDLAGLHVRESGSSTGGFALTGSTYAVSGENVTFTLTQSQRTSLAALTTPQLDIDANAVSDLSENGIAAAPDREITVDDTAPPTFSSAEYTTGNGELAVTFSESIGATVDLAGLHVRESGSSTGGFALTGSTYAVSDATATFTLTQSQRTSLAALTTPQLDIDANAVSDLSENGIAAAPDREITVDDTAPPTFSSAEYTTGNGELAVTFSESLHSTVDLAGLHVRESGSSTGGFALTGSTYAVSDATATFTLTQSQRTSLAALTTPQLDIDANAVSDLSENGIAAAPDLAITIDDTAPPTFSSAEYTTGNGELAVTFSESIGATVDLAGLHVRESGSSTGGFALTGSTYAVSDATATFTLTQSQRTSLAALTTPQLDIDANAVSDLSENGIAAAPDREITVDDTAPPTLDTTPPTLDTTPPVFEARSNIHTSYNPGFPMYGIPAAIDDVDGHVPVSCDPPPRSIKPGNTTVTCTATDSSENTAVITFTISIAEQLPQPPHNLRATTSETTVTLIWNAPINDDSVSSYIVLSRTGSEMSIVGATDDTTFTINSLQPGTTYTYHVRSVNFNGTSEEYVTVTATTKSYPSLTLDAVVTDDSVILTWNPIISDGVYYEMVKNDKHSWILSNDTNTLTDIGPFQEGEIRYELIALARVDDAPDTILYVGSVTVNAPQG